MLFGKRNEKLSENLNYLNLIPCKLLSEERTEDGLIFLLIPRFSSKFANKYFLPKLKSPNIKLKLDEIGSETWLLIDSKKNVSTIAGELEKKFGDRIKPVNQRLTSFLTQLYSYKFISFIEFKEKGD
jgi:hypothetical protein